MPYKIAAHVRGLVEQFKQAIKRDEMRLLHIGSGAWDIAAYFDSQERPKDLLRSGSVAANAFSNFNKQHSYYGKVLNGRLLGTCASSTKK